LRLRRTVGVGSHARFAGVAGGLRIRDGREATIRTDPARSGDRRLPPARRAAAEAVSC
jgi:hypothetical protein